MIKQKAMMVLPEYFTGLIKTSSAEKPEWNMEMIRNGCPNSWSYVDACMISAALALHQITREQQYLTFSDQFLGWYVQSDGLICTYRKEEWNIDNICPGKNLFALFKLTGRKKYEKAIHVLQSQIDEMPRTKYGNFWHKKIYPWQVWLDGLYMGQPFHMQYEVVYRDGKGCGDSFDQFRNVQKLMRKENGLYYHGYDESRQMYWADKESGCSPNCWGRAIGWLMAALADTLEVSDPVRYPQGVSLLSGMAEQLAEALIPWQHEEGMFYQVVDKPEEGGNYLESSGTLLIAYGILKCIRLGYLPKKYSWIAESAFEGTVNRYLFQTADGSLQLNGICLVAGLGGEQHRDGSLAYYFGEPVVANEGKGIAPLLLCYTELLCKDCGS